MAEVERDEFCVSVLKARMADNALPTCKICDDVTSYRPVGPALDAEVVTAGFPCQASHFSPHLQAVHIGVELLAEFVLAQGVSSAGRQAGLRDERSRLVAEPFRVWDLLPKKCGAEILELLLILLVNPISTVYTV